MIGFMNLQRGLPSHTVWALAKMPPSTLNYWVQTGLVVPSHRRRQGKRIEQWWSVNDAVVVRTIRALRQTGASLQLIREARAQIEERGDTLAGTWLFWDGNDIALLDDEGTIRSVRRRGQLLLFFLGAPIGDWFVQADEMAELVDLDQFPQSGQETQATAERE